MITSRSIKIKQKLTRKREEEKTVVIQLTLTSNHELSKDELDNIIDEYTNNHNFRQYELVKND